MNSWMKTYAHSSQWQTWQGASWLIHPFVLSYILPEVTCSTNKCVIGLYAGVTCCIHKLIATLCHPYAFISRSSFTLGGISPGRRHVSSACRLDYPLPTSPPPGHCALYHIAVIWGNISPKQRIRSITGREEAKHTQNGHPQVTDTRL